MTKWARELDTPFPLNDEQRASYANDGYIKLQNVFSRELLAYYRAEISAKVAELSANTLPLKERTTYGKAFLQILNLWRKSQEIREFVFSRRLAQISTELMGCCGVRLYHDQALYKEPGGGITPWHADQYYFPVSNDNVITAWIPLQNTPVEMGPLVFCKQSHRFHYGRDLEISDESETTLKEALQAFKQDETPYNLGDVSFHSGWTFHRAGTNSTQHPRQVMTVIYIDQEMRVAKPKNKNQAADKDEFCPSLPVGALMDSHMTPLIFSHERQHAFREC
jgi:ectoine hydroxylase-related dioxygenase (phytanoyl-CoA dioxygenase family)